MILEFLHTVHILNPSTVGISAKKAAARPRRMAPYGRPSHYPPQVILAWVYSGGVPSLVSIAHGLAGLRRPGADPL